MEPMDFRAVARDEALVSRIPLDRAWTRGVGATLAGGERPVPIPSSVTDSTRRVEAMEPQCILLVPSAFDSNASALVEGISKSEHLSVQESVPSD